MNDLLLDENFDLQITAGDLTIGASTYQHQQCLLLADKGSFKQYLATGVGAINYLKDENPDDFLREVRQQFAADGMQVKAIAFENQKIKIDAKYS